MPRLSATFRALQVRNFRVYFWGQLVSLCGNWLQLVAQAWLVLELSNNDGTTVGIVAAMQPLAALLFGASAGAVADRFRKRDLLITTQTSLMAISALLTLLTWTNHATLWNIALLAFLSGFLSIIDLPTRQALVNEMVPAEHVTNAVSLNATVGNSARMIGPAIAGLLITRYGIEWCFLFNALSYLVSVASLLAIRNADLRMGPLAARGRGQVVAGLRYIRSSPVLLSNLTLTLVVGTLAFNFPTLLPLLAKLTFHGDSGLFSRMNVAMGVGAVVGALMVASRHQATPRFLMRVGFLGGIAECVAAAAPNTFVLMPLLAFVGVCTIAFFATSNALVQLEAEPAMRGRVLAVRATTFVGGGAIGSPIIGAVCETFGPRVGFALGGVAMMSVFAWYAFYLRSATASTPSGLEPEPDPSAVDPTPSDTHRAQGVSQVNR